MKRRVHARRGSAGFSLVEVLIATLIFFGIAIGVIPLFMRALVSNKTGADATTVSNHGLSRLEEMTRPPFNSPPMEPSVREEYLSDTDRTWKPGTAPADGDRAYWTRMTTITQHRLNDLMSDGEFNEPLPAGTDPSEIHLKVIEVEIAMVRDPGNPLGRRRNLDLRTIRPY